MTAPPSTSRMEPPDPADYLPRWTTSTRMLLVVLLALGGVIGGLVSLGGSLIKLPPPPPPVDPVVRLTPADDVQAALDRAPAGTIIELTGEFHGQLQLLQKRELVLRAGEGGAALISSERPPLVVKDGCKVIRLEQLELRYASDTPRTFPALIVRDGAEITLEGCTLQTSSGDGLVAERISSLTISGCEIQGTTVGMVLRDCDRLSVSGTRLTRVRTSGDSRLSTAVLGHGISGRIEGLRASGWGDGVHVEAEGQLTLAAPELSGIETDGVGVQVGAGATLSIIGGKIERFELGLEVKTGGHLKARQLTLGSLTIGVKAATDARMLDLAELTLAGEVTIPLKPTRDLPDSWSIDPKLLQN